MMIKRWLGVAVGGCLIASSVSFSEDVPENLAPNPSFEQPENAAGQIPTDWRVFASKTQKVVLSDKTAASGRQSLMMCPQGTPREFCGVSFELPVTEGEKYTFEAKYIADREDRPSGTMDLRLVIEWKRADGTEISRFNSQPIKAFQISRLRWETMTIRKAAPPQGVAKGVFGIHLCENERGGSGTVYVDDVVVVKN